MKKETDLEKTLSVLTERVKLIEDYYNPDELNLHFENLKYADSALFEALLSIGQDAWKIIQNNQSRKTLYWFYDFFQLISRGSGRILSDNTQKYISEDVVVRLALLLSEISQLTGVPDFEGDITIRNDKALKNILLAFGNIRKIFLTRVKELNNQEMINRAKSAINSVKQYEKNDNTVGSYQNKS
ncbi:MAG TPA: hypothetical protein VII93_10395 [Anaerolineales bacterium]